MEIDPAGLDEPQVAEADRATAVSGDALHTPAQLCRQPLDRAAELARGALAGGGVRRRRRHRARAHPGAVAGREGPATTTAIPAMPIDPFTPRIVLRAMSFYVTTPIYYVNAEPHLGHAYTTIGADILARHMRQRGEDVFFLTGTDEHGEPVAQAAEREGVTPRELADRNAQRFLDLMPKIDVSNDFFIRTTDPRHVAKVQEVIQRVHDNGHVYEGTYEGFYCPRCADFKTADRARPRQHLPDPRDRARGRDRGELVLPALELPGASSSGSTRSSPDFVAPDFRRNEALAFIKRRPPGRLAVAAEAELGGAAAVGPRAGHVRLVRRPPQLLHGALATRARART